MLRDAVRGVVVVAAGIAEEAGRLVVGAASELLERSGVDVAAVERLVAGQFPPSAQSLQTLASEVVTVGRAGVDLAVGVARGEVERVFEQVGDQVVRVGVVLSYLEGRLRGVEEADPAGPEPSARRAPRADDLFGAGWDADGPETVTETVTEDAAGFAPTPAGWSEEPDEPGEPGSPAAPSAPEARPSGRRGPVAKGPTPADMPAADEAAVRRPAGKKDAAGRTPSGQLPAKKAAAKKTTAKKSAAKTTAKKTTTRKATSKRTAAQPPAAKKAAPRKTVVKKTVTRRPEPQEGGDA